MDWKSYQPHEALYWALGGPFIPVEEIEPKPLSPDHIGPGMKGDARRKWILKCLANAETELAKAIAQYRAVKERGMEAIPESIRESWRQRVHAGEDRPGQDPISQAMAWTYHEIRSQRGRIRACEQALDDIDRAQSPLLFPRDKS
jgi:uncharacterized membrane protein YccC